MPLINTHEVIDRHVRPPVEQRVMLRTFFVNDGRYRDPFAISSVHVFKRDQNISPATILDSDGLVASSQTSLAAMVFGPTGTGEVHSDSSFNESNYNQEIFENVAGQDPCSGVNGVYKLGKGEFACVLDGIFGTELSGVDQNGDIITNTASQATRYLDIWTVKMTEGSTWNTFINHFELFDDTFFTITEPLLLRAKNTLFNKQIILGSKTDIKVGTELTVENRNIDESIKNIFNDSVISNAKITITKHNEDSNLPSRVIVVDEGIADITSDNTIIYSFDTDAVFKQGFIQDDALGSRTGTYSVQVTYNLISEKIVSPFMYFILK